MCTTFYIKDMYEYSTVYICRSFVYKRIMGMMNMIAPIGYALLPC